MHKLTGLFACALLAACQTPEPISRFRNPTAPIWSNAQFDLSRLPGRWRQSATFAMARSGCAPGGAEIQRTGSGFVIAARLCLDGKDTALAGPLTVSGPGRFQVAGQEWWVIWVDTDYRTLAIGTPSGAFGFVLNRGGALPPDRLRAAREIFDFNGYDLRNLETY